jgi:hypothetical protein
VHRVNELSEREFNSEYVSSSRPCVIKGAVEHWAAMQNWRDKDYLKNRCGLYNVWLFSSDYYLTLRRLELGRKMVTFAQAIDHLHADETKIGIVVAAHTDRLKMDLGGLSFMTKAEPAFFYDAARYFFYRNAGTTWHFHTFDETLMSQIVGSKKIGLLKANTPYYHAMRTFFFKEEYYDDPTIFDGFDNTGLEWFSAELSEGDALYIPPLWWHGVIPTTEHFGATTAVTWRSPPHVIANTIRQMASGEIEMVGDPNMHTFPVLFEEAKRLGLENELAMAWKNRI